MMINQMVSGQSMRKMSENMFLTGMTGNMLETEKFIDHAVE